MAIAAGIAMQAFAVLACLIPDNLACVPPGESQRKDAESGQGTYFPTGSPNWEGNIKITVEGCTVPSSKDANPDEQGNLSTGPLNRNCIALADLHEFSVIEVDELEYLIQTSTPGGATIIGSCETSIPDGASCVGGNFPGS